MKVVAWQLLHVDVSQNRGNSVNERDMYAQHSNCPAVIGFLDWTYPKPNFYAN